MTKQDTASWVEKDRKQLHPVYHKSTTIFTLTTILYVFRSSNQISYFIFLIFTMNWDTLSFQ